MKVHALLLLAEIAADGGRPAVAGQALEAAAGLGAGSPGVLLAVGDLYRLRLRDRDRALAQYRRAAALDRNGALDAAIRQRLAALARPG